MIAVSTDFTYEEVRRGGWKKPTRKKLRTRKKAKTGRETV